MMQSIHENNELLLRMVSYIKSMNNVIMVLIKNVRYSLNDRYVIDMNVESNVVINDSLIYIASCNSMMVYISIS